MASIEPGKVFQANEEVTAAKLAQLVSAAVISQIGRGDLADNFYGITAASSEPSGMEEGELWWDTTLDLLMVHNGSQVLPLSQPQESLIEYRSGLTTVIPGDIVIVNAAVDNTVITTATSFVPLFAGVVRATCGSTQTARIARIGHLGVNFTGTGSRGEYAYTSDTAGKARASSTATQGAFGILTSNVTLGAANVLTGAPASNI